MGKSPVELTRSVASEMYNTKAVRTAEAVGMLLFTGHLAKHYVPPLMDWAKKRWENRQAERAAEREIQELPEGLYEQ